MKILWPGLAIACLTDFSRAASGHSGLLPYVFEPLPLGSIKPQGWLRDTLQAMADGLPGHVLEFYRYVKESAWLGGDHEYSELQEAAPYWFNYMVPLAYSIDDTRLKRQIRQFVDYVLGHQADDGWIGPNTTDKTCNLWARFPLMLGFAQLVEADQTYKDRVISAMHRFFEKMHSMLLEDNSGYSRWGMARGQDMIMTLQWMYENHPGDDNDILFESMRLLYEGAINWSHFFSGDIFPKQDVDTLSANEIPYDFLHVVNLGQALKAAAVARRFTHNDALLESIRNGVNWTFLYHGSPSGAIIGDERITGLSPTRGSELCGVVESMFSLSYLYQAIGDKSFADRCELAAFNALPVMITSDAWAHQYVAQTNQPYSQPLTEVPFWDVNNTGQSYGLEPHYIYLKPCCTVNHPQGYPKFTAGMFARAGRNGLAHALLGPASLSTVLNKANSVIVDCETNYPFEHLLLYRIDAQRSFDFYIRVPEWYIVEDSSIQVNHGDTYRLSPDPLTGMHKVAVESGKSTITYKLGARVRIEERANDTIAIHHGPLLYALEIGANVTTTHPRDWKHQLPLPAEMTVPETRDYIITNTTAWAIAIDPSTLKLHHANPANTIKRLSNPIFQAGAPPTSITAQGCEIDWDYWKDVPADPPLAEMRKCKGNPFEVKLIPYGAAKIHMAQLPTVDLSESLDRVGLPAQPEQQPLGTGWEGGNQEPQRELRSESKTLSSSSERHEHLHEEL